jgi:hypothetical protein
VQGPGFNPLTAKNKQNKKEQNENISKEKL